MGRTLRPMEGSSQPMGKTFRPMEGSSQPMGKTLRPMGGSLQPRGKTLQHMGRTLPFGRWKAQIRVLESKTRVGRPEPGFSMRLGRTCALIAVGPTQARTPSRFRPRRILHPCRSGISSWVRRMAEVQAVGWLGWGIGGARSSNLWNRWTSNRCVRGPGSIRPRLISSSATGSPTPLSASMGP